MSIPFFWKQIHHGTEKHSSDNILQDVNKCVDELSEIDVKPAGLITDNEEKMKSVRTSFYKKHNEENLIENGWAPVNPVAAPGDPPHALQLVVKDVMEHHDFAQTVKKAAHIAKKFKNTRYNITP